MPTPTFDDLVIVAKTVWGEARGESEQGKIAVAWVVKNRWQSGKWFGRGSVADVCLRKWQFSCWNPSDPNRAKIDAISLDDPLLQECLWAALCAFRNKGADPTCGSTHYFDWRTPTPSWAEGKGAGLRIGHHAFYQGVD